MAIEKGFNDKGNVLKKEVMLMVSLITDDSS